MEQVLRLREEFIVNDPNFVAKARTAFIVKWSILGGIFLIFTLWFVGGYFHAKRRIRKGLPPLAYHRFLVPAHMRAPRKMADAPGQFQFTRMEDGGYHLEQMPPPVYDPTHPSPPNYLPPDGASKVDPVQGQTPLQARPASARSPRGPWLNKINKILPGRKN